jgi:hypothetical protein
MAVLAVMAFVIDVFVRLIVSRRMRRDMQNDGVLDALAQVS